MSGHRVVATTRAQELPKKGAGIDLIVFHRGRTLGHLTIGRGGVRWVARNKSKGRALSWGAFARAMEA